MICFEGFSLLGKVPWYFLARLVQVLMCLHKRGVFELITPLEILPSPSRGENSLSGEAAG